LDTLPGPFPEAVANCPSLRLPLCVDLDGTLVRSDTLAEGVAGMLVRLRLGSALFQLIISGRSAFKQRVADGAPIDPALLPYNEPLLAYLATEKSRGRYLVLATAVDSRVANDVARYLGIFDEVIASNGKDNLKGEAKAVVLCDRFGARGFVYAGNSAADQAIWQVAAAAVLVNVSGRIARAVTSKTEVEAAFDGRASRLVALLAAMRPNQWVKNLLVFVPIITAHALHEEQAWFGAALAFVAFSAIASAVYMINDATDLAADRQHPSKRSRPFASGALPLLFGLVAALLLACVGLGVAAVAGLLSISLIYMALAIGYSLRLKEMPLVDVFVLAALYTLRLFGGGQATGHELSLWLLAFSGFLFLALALLKRVGELTARKEESGSSRRGYLITDVSLLQTLGCGATFAASLVLALFVQREVTAQIYTWPSLLWGTVPLILFWQCRLWLSTARGNMHDDPIVYAARDWVSWLVGALLILLLTLAYSAPLRVQ
jgi:4-hydroxybenzoate polyprenyltransferase